MRLTIGSATEILNRGRASSSVAARVCSYVAVVFLLGVQWLGASIWVALAWTVSGSLFDYSLFILMMLYGTNGAFMAVLSVAFLNQLRRSECDLELLGLVVGFTLSFVTGYLWIGYDVILVPATG